MERQKSNNKDKLSRKMPLMSYLGSLLFVTALTQNLMVGQQLHVTIDTISNGNYKNPLVLGIEVGDKDTRTYQVLYYPNGMIQGVAFYYKGVEIGYKLQYYQSGKLQYKCQFNWDKKYLSLPIKFVADTDFVSIALKVEPYQVDANVYRNPKVGEEVRYYENGNIKTVCRYKEMIWTKKNSTEIKHGSWEYYAPDGKLRFRRIYDNNIIVSQEWFY